MVLAANIENASDERRSIMSVHSIIRVKFRMHVASIFHAQLSGRNGVRVKCQSKNGECAGETSLYGAKRSRHFLEIPGAYQFTQQISLKEYPDA